MKTSQIRALLKTLVGQRCFSLIGGPGTAIVLELGKPVPRSLKLHNRSLPFVARAQEGEYSLLVECAWTVDAPGERIGSSSEAADRRALEPVRVLEDKRVEKVTLTLPGFDLKLGFEGGYALNVLATHCDPLLKHDNWAYWCPNGAVTIGAGSRPRAGGEPPPKDVPDRDLVELWKERWQKQGRSIPEEE